MHDKFHRPFRTVLFLNDDPGTLCRANFRLSLRDSFGLLHFLHHQHLDKFAARHEFEAKLV
jgi:hypothetical protein